MTCSPRLLVGSRAAMQPCSRAAVLLGKDQTERMVYEHVEV